MRGFLVGALAGAAVAGGAFAYASIPDSGGVIHGCYTPGGTTAGKLRVINTDAGQSCKATANPLNWNQQGVQGPPGPAGPQGPSGSPTPDTFRSYAVTLTIASGNDA